MRFSLIGRVDYAVGSCHDDRSVLIRKRFSAPTKKAGIEKARDVIHKYHEEYRWRTDYGLCAELRTNRIPIWEIKFHDAEPAEPAIKARPAQPAKPERFKEKILR